MNWTNEFFGAALIAAAGALVVVPVELWARRSSPRPEVARKLLHCAGTLPCLFIPTLIHSTTVAIALALALAAGLWAGTRSGLLSSVSAVARQSHGAVYYPLAILGRDPGARVLELEAHAVERAEHPRRAAPGQQMPDRPPQHAQAPGDEDAARGQRACGEGRVVHVDLLLVPAAGRAHRQDASFTDVERLPAPACADAAGAGRGPR